MNPGARFPRADGPTPLDALVAAIAVEYPADEAERAAAAEVLEDFRLSRRFDEGARRVERSIRRGCGDLKATVRSISIGLDAIERQAGR